MTAQMTTTGQRTGQSPFDDWLAEIEAKGQLKRISAEVDPNLECSTVNYMAGRTAGSPALLFENIKGHPGQRALYNMLGTSLERFALTFGLGHMTHPTDVVRVLKQRMHTKMTPTVLDPCEALVNQNILNGADVDITMFPAPRMWPKDGGKYIGTYDAVITSDPETDRMNVGTYRQMIVDPRSVTFYASPGKDGVLDREKWWALGKPAPVAVAYGIDPVLATVAGNSFPKTESEYDYYGGIHGKPVEVFRSDLTGLLLPANAEIIVEGFCTAGDTADEGPFGEFTGYYAKPSSPTPVLRIERVRYRHRPILTCALMANFPSCEGELAAAMTRSANIWNDLDKLGVPGICGVWSPPEATGMGMTVISIKQLYAGHASQALSLAAQCMGGAYFAKYVVVVDDDIDPTQLSEVVWAIVTRSRPDQSIDILRNTWSSFLDPSQNPPEKRPWGSKCLIDATMEHRYLKSFSERSKLSRNAYERVSRRWHELGFEGAPPRVTTFEQGHFEGDLA